jgi:hypothetical protein
MTTTLLRPAFLAIVLGLLLSCGGGGGGGSGGPAGVAGSGNGTFATVPGDASNAGLLASDASTGGDSGGPAGSTGAPGGGTTTASGGDDASGVGSGGTGVSTADATGIGAVDGAGSIIVNGLRYDTTGVAVSIEDAPSLQLGMSVKVTGPVSADFTSGAARRIESAAEVRGVLASVDLARGRFVVLGSTITTDEATVWADSSGLAAIAPGSTLQVWGLPAAPGVLLATRVEQRPPSAPILSGTVQALDAASRTFTLGGMVVDYSQASVSGSLDGRPLANGVLVRVRASAGAGNRLHATQVQWWYPSPTANAAPLQLGGIVTDYAGPGSLRVLGIPIDASNVQVTGGPAAALGNGVRVEVAGFIGDGILKATQLRIRHLPGTGGPASFSLEGIISNFDSVSSFRVRGQVVNASGANVEFVNGNASMLGKGVRIGVEGERVVDGVLIATRVSFK